MKIARTAWSLLFVVMSLLALIVLGNGCVLQPSFSSPQADVAPSGFVTRSGTQLRLNGHSFRFAGANMHWLPFDDSTNYTSQFRINDGFDAAKEMGLTVVRSHNLGISVGCSNCIEPRLGVFNKMALVHDDYVIKAAREHGIRLIIPLTDNWHFAEGGKHTFTDWRGISDENEFYYNTQVINDFEIYIRTLLNHVNKYTGIAYKNDPTIMVWETGNELDPPPGWTQTISTYIKSIDHNHLVMDGSSGVDPNAASLVHVDIVSNHYYPMSTVELKYDADAAKKVGKAFIVGEFDWNNASGGDTLSSFLSTVETDPIVSGDMFWELWSHDDQYGYVSGEIQYTLHYPGDSIAMRASVRQLRMHAYKMRHASVPAHSTPGAAVINAVGKDGPNNVLIWRGTAVAASYTIKRSTVSANGPWKVICDRCVPDMSTPWVDTTTPAGVSWYTVVAYNLAGVAGKPSTPYQAASAGVTVIFLQ